MCSNCIFNSFHLFLQFVCFSFTPWNVAVVMRFGVVFLTQKSPSTSWIVTYHVFIAGFAFPDILKTEYCLSLSAMNIFLMTPVSLPASLWSCHRIVTRTHSQTSNDATSDSVDPHDSEDDEQSVSSEMGEFIEHSYEVPFVPDTDVECVTVHNR